MTEETKIEAEGIAERLRSIYQSYSCENDLPSHEDIVTAINKDIDEYFGLGKILQDTMDFYLSAISYEEALETVKGVSSLIKTGKRSITRIIGTDDPMLDDLIPISVRAKKYMEAHNQEVEQNFKYKKPSIEWELNDALGLHEENRVLEEKVAGEYEE